MREIDYLPGTALLLWGLGETAEQEDDLEAAYATYAAALAISRQAADHKETPRCLLGMARVLLKRGSAGADVQALLTECTQLFRDQGAQTALAEAEQLTSQLAQATAERPRGGSLPDGLTVREAEIVRLIATGASNSRIAAELVVSVRTIERHIENIYAKLDVHGRSARAAVASYAIRTGLSPASTPPDTRTTSRTYASVRMS
jgi:DNA-binding NarL/FixJ family response regulator